MDKNDEVSEFRAALYVRTATKHQQYSPDNQSDKIRDYASKRGIEIVKILDAFALYAPETLALVRMAVSKAEYDLGFTRLASDTWARLDDISIDYAVMEHAENLTVVPFGGAWSDLGDWQ